MKNLIITLLLVVPISVLAQSIIINQVEVIGDGNNNGYVEPNEIVQLQLLIENNSPNDFLGFSIEESYTHYQAEFIGVVLSQSSLLASDSLYFQVEYLTNDFLLPWDFNVELNFISSSADTFALGFEVPVEFFFECSDLSILSVNVYPDSTYPGIEVEVENNGVWDLQYPGIQFITADPFVEFPDRVGYYYVLPNDFSYPMWDEIWVDPNAPQSHEVEATLLFVTMDSLVQCELPFTFILNPSTTSVSNISEEAISIYPNPVSDNLIIDFEDHADRHIAILSIDGKLQQQKRINLKHTELDIQSLSPGVYFVKFDDLQSNKTNYHKVIKK